MIWRYGPVAATFGLLSACTMVAGLADLEFSADGEPVGGSGGVGGGGGMLSAGAGGVAGGVGDGGGGMSFTDDELDGEFGAGFFEGTEWDDDRVRLSAGVPNGTFLSRVFDAGSDATWTSLSWAPNGPYGKPLPDLGTSESGYPQGAADMTGNALLLHFDGEGTVAHGELLTESSGFGLSPEVWHVTQGTMSFVPGMFGSAIATTLDDHLFIAVEPGSSLDFGTDDFSWALWVNTTFVCDAVRTWMGIENAARVHLWLGCKNLAASTCCTAPTGTQAGGTFISSMGDSTCYCGVKAVDDGAWHHVAMVKRGHQTATIEVYIDGALDSSKVTSFTLPMDFPEATRFTLGAFDFYPPAGDPPLHQTEALLDDVAVWTRGLDAAEIAGLARRGRLSMPFQVRVCTEADCADGPSFVGPDGTANTFFEDDGVAAPVQQELTSLPRGRYFQYAVVLDSRMAGETPALHSVTVVASP